MGTTEIIGWVVSALSALVMLLGKQQMDSLNKRLESLDSEMKHVKDEYFKKEDFKEFKYELWTRLDRMEASFENRLDKAIKSYAIKDIPDLKK